MAGIDRVAHRLVILANSGLTRFRRMPSCAGAAVVCFGSPRSLFCCGLLAGAIASASQAMATPLRPFFVEEFALTCESGADVSFFELSANVRITFGPNDGLEVFDHEGMSLYRVPRLSNSAQTFFEGRPFLVATAAFAAASGATPDLIVPRELDPIGGRIELFYDPQDGSGPTGYHELRYGPGGEAIPSAGRALVRGLDESWRESQPSPMNHGLHPAWAGGCFVGCSPTWVGQNEGPPLDQTFEGDQFDWLTVSGRISANLSAGTMDFRVPGSEQIGGGFSVVFSDAFTLEGIPPGDSVSFFAVLTVSDSPRPDPHGGFVDSQIEMSVQGRTAYAYGFNGTSEMRLPVHLQSDRTFSIRFYEIDWAYRGFSTMHSALSFDGLPAGARLRSCHGLVVDQTVATLVSLASAVRDERAAHLRWYAAGPLPGVRVERCLRGMTWLPYSAATIVDGEGFLTFDDVDILATESYGYRLVWTENGSTIRSEETWLDSQSPDRFGIVALRPNPASGPVSIRFTLPTAGDCTIDVFDIVGRRVVTRSARGLTAGSHDQALLSRGALAPGIYNVRLQSSQSSSSARLIIFP